MEPPEVMEADLRPPADQLVAQEVGQSSINQPGPGGGPGTSQDQRQPRAVTDDWQHQQQQLEFQDSNLSPALPLLPAASRSQPNITEYSLLQQTDNEFSPLRPYPDVSLASTRPPQDDTAQASEPDSLSQHPLAIETILSEEGAGSSSFCSLSQHSLPPGGAGGPSGRTGRQEVTPRASRGSEEQKLSEDETYFLSGYVPAQRLLDILQKEVGMPSSSSSSSAVSSASEILMRREGPPGEAASLPPPSRPNRPSEVCNITMGSRSTLPDLSSESLHRELVSESQKRRRKTPSPPAQGLTSRAPEPSATQTNRGDLPSTGPPSAGLHREHDLWSSGNQTGMEGSYLGFLPQSQSTPGIFQALPKSSVAGKLSAIESDSAASEPDLHRLEEHASAKVQSLPSLNYMQKVDAWRANQSAGKPSLFDSLALQGFSGVSPKKKAYEAVSDSLNRILSDKVRRLQQPPAEQGAAQSPPSSPRRGEAAGSAPSDKDNTRPFSSPLGKSQSHSSLSTVVMSTQKEEGRLANAAAAATSAPPAALDLGCFSDVSAEQDLDLTLSSSQDSNKSGRAKLVTSVGASSATSLEVDNYAPYWTSKPPSTPPPLNIEERIPLYLHNLGIDQSPSTILTPFAPRGPIREPEFSPTDLCTIKGSTQPSEGGSPQKAELSRSSALSVDSSVSAPFSVDSLGPAASLPEPTRPEPLPADACVVRSKTRPASASQQDSAHSSSFQPNQQKDGAGERLDPGLRSVVTRAKTGEAPPSGSSGAATAAAVYPVPPHLMSDDDILLSLRRRTGQDSAFSLFGSSALWPRSSSDSMLTSETTRQSSVGRESATPPPQPAAAAAGAGSVVVLSKSTRRAEPEGCSAAPPDTNVPQQLLAAAAAAAASLTSTMAETILSPEAQETPEPRPPPSSSSRARDESDQGEDGSSQSSLAERVAKLLEDPSFAASSAPSSADPDDGKGRERATLKASAKGGEPSVLNVDDRKQIEEIKKELLLKFPMKGQLSSDTESSVASSDRVQGGGGTARPPPQPPLWSLPANASDSASLHQATLEARFRTIAAREGVSLYRPPQHAPTSISIATCRRPGSASPPASLAPPHPVTEPLHLSDLSSGTQLRQRQDTVGGRFEGPPPPPASDDGHAPDSPASHVSQVRFNLAPKAAAATADHGSAPDKSLKPHGEFAPLRRSPSTVVSPDEGVGLTTPPEWNQAREPRPNAAAAHHRAAVSKRVAVSEPPPVPVLLPYKPRGAEDLYYVPQFEADVSSIGRSDTTMESSHTGSDDAVPPRFASDVLGQQDPGLDRGVRIRHSEGIYSKRVKAVSAGMEQPKHTDSPRQTPNKPASKSSRAPVDVPRSSSPKHHGTSYRDQGTSPLQFLQEEEEEEERHLRPSPPTSEPEGDAAAAAAAASARQQVSLDELWRRFCVRWAIEQSRPASGQEASLLERLEHLSRLIYSSSAAEERLEAARRRRREGGGVGGGGTPRARGGHAPLSDGEASQTSSGSVSTVDTDRLVRVFGAQRVKQPRSGPALKKLHSAIDRQRRGRSSDRRDIAESTDESSVVVDSASSTCTSVLPAQPRASRTSAKLVSKKIQTASDLEIVRNGTRRHTRDVGTTFPSPLEPVTLLSTSSSGSERGRRGQKPHRKSKPRPPPLSWFIPAEGLRSSEGRKENRREGEEESRPSAAWFQPYGRTQPWREPLRERQVHEDVTADTGPGPDDAVPESSHMTKRLLTLQEALEQRRPDFISRSEERMKRLSQQAEERMQQGALSRQRYGLFGLYTTAERLQGPPGFGVLRRAVPRKEMIQRSKKIYENLPEIRRRKADERRKAEYRSYRLNAQLFNKRITNHVLGKRLAWQ